MEIMPITDCELVVILENQEGYVATFCEESCLNAYLAAHYAEEELTKLFAYEDLASIHFGDSCPTCFPEE